MKRFGKKLAVLCGVGVCAMMLTMVNSVPVYAATGEETVSPQYTNLEWYYKYIDGVLMMRLWNHTTGEWVTDWVPAVG